jgi:tetratricopeptide (TPR) repeat protein
VEALINTSWEWQNSPNFAYDKVEALVRAAREQADAGRLSAWGIDWTLFLEAHLDKIYSRHHEAKAKLLQIRMEPDHDPYTAANCLKALGNVHLRLSEVSEARERYEQALPVYLRLLGEARERYEQALPVYLRLLGVSKARERYEQALPVYLRLLGEARERYEQALPVYQAIGDKLGEANCLRSFGDLYREQGEYATAQQYYENAAVRFTRIGNREGEAECLEGLAKLYEAVGEKLQATESWAQAAAVYEASNIPKRAALCWEAADKLG